MQTLDADSTLAELVTANPSVAATMERYGLDYCCGGKRRLADAVAAAGLGLDDVLASLQAAAAGTRSQRDWTDLTPAQLVDHLEATHHAHLHEELPRLVALADKVTSVHGTRHPELADVRQLVHELHADLEPHMMKEERVLFPMIRELDGATEAPSFHCGSLENPIAMMTSEHDTTGDLLSRLRAATDDYTVPDDACASYRMLYAGLADVEADTHLHVHKENNVLFPAVIDAERALGGA